MKFQVLQENIEKAVNITSRFANTRAQLPVLGNILITTRKSKIYITSTNLEISASIQIGAKIDEEGDISVPAKVISELISNLPKETISIETEREQLKISSSGFSSTILGMNSSDFPKVPNFIDEKKSISFPKEVLVQSLEKVSFASSIDETRPILTGVLFILGKGELSLVSTDGFRLSRKIIKNKEFLMDKKSFVIPKGVLSEISRGVFTGESILMEPEEGDKQVIFGIDDTVLSSRLIEGDYPDFEKIIPKESNIKVFLDKEEFLRAIKLASIFARESANVVKIKIFKDSIKVSAESSTAGSQEAKIDAKIESDISETNNGKFEIAFNYRYLEEFIHSVKGEEICMEFLNPTSAGVFKDTTDSEYLHLIMPVKI